MLELCNSKVHEVDGFWGMKGSHLYNFLEEKFDCQFKSLSIYNKNDALQEHESLNHFKKLELS